MHVLLVTGESITVSAVTTALQSNGQLAREDVCRDLSELGNRLTVRPTPAVLVDIDSQAAGQMGMLDALVRRFPDTRFIVLANTMDPRLMLQAMQAGARHFLTKADVPGTLRDVLRRLCQPAETPSGHVTSVFSASGGSGATTLAVNLANELQLAANRSTMIVDLDYVYGGVAAYLGLEGTYGVLDLQERAGSIDPDLVTTSAVSHGERLKVLVSATPARLGMGGGYSRLKDLISASAHASPLVVVDAPRLPLDVAAELASVSNFNLLVLQLNVKDVRAARSMLAALRSRGVSTDSFILLVNRYRRRAAAIELDEARKALSGANVECLSNDFQAASESLNLGQPLEKTAPRSTFRKEIQQLAGRVLTAVAPVKGVQP
jgi:pilus assembly protein CpaE